MLDGVLTANIQPEGLREGDVVVLATTSEHVDPVLKEHVETIFAPWGEAQIGLAHARLSWPAGVELKIAKTGDLPPAQQTARDGVKSYELVMRNAEPVIAPKGAPVRFKIGRLGEATDFRSWADAAKLMMPLYSTAAVVAPSGPLRDELEKIRKASTDPKVRAEQALRLVQERVRYVALLMGEGGYVPANADSTWSRRFGDCKAKTALLLALLHELGIAADPVMANLGIGDAVAARVPMIAIFNHVFVRAHIAGKDYWLDGTRTGDTTLDAIDTPDYGWVLPLTENAQLVHLVRGALAVPSFERHVDVDASNGVFATAAITISETYRKDFAVEYNAAYSQLSADQRSELMRNEAKGYFDSFDMTTSSVRFDPQERQLSIVINGKAKLNWDNGWFFVPTSSIAFDPDFDPTGRRFPRRSHQSQPSAVRQRYCDGQVADRLRPAPKTPRGRPRDPRGRGVCANGKRRWRHSRRGLAASAASPRKYRTRRPWRPRRGCAHSTRTACTCRCRPYLPPDRRGLAGLGAAGPRKRGGLHRSWHDVHERPQICRKHCRFYCGAKAGAQQRMGPGRSRAFPCVAPTLRRSAKGSRGTGPAQRGECGRPSGARHNG